MNQRLATIFLVFALGCTSTTTTTKGSGGPDAGSHPDAAPHPDSGPGVACPGRVIAVETDCASPCEVFTFLDGISSNDHEGTDWCASECANDADCPSGQFCDLSLGLGPAGHGCVLACANNASCQSAGFPECDPTSSSDPRLSCF